MKSGYNFLTIKSKDFIKNFQLMITFFFVDISTHSD